MRGDYRASLAYAHNWLGETIRDAIDRGMKVRQYSREDAEKEYTGAIGLQGTLNKQEPQNATYQQQLARTYYNRGINRFYMGNQAGSKLDFQEAISLLEPLAAKTAAEPNTETSREPAQDLARVYNNYGVELVMTKDAANAERYYDQSIALAEQLIARQPQNREYKAELSQYSFNDASLQAGNGRFEEADAHGQRALDLLEELQKPTPALTLAMVKTLQLEGQLWCVSDPARGVALTDRALGLLRDLDKTGTQKPGSLNALYANIGANYLELGRGALLSNNRPVAQSVLARLQDAITHVPEAQRNSFTVPYKELHTALYKAPGGR
jgi:tetratricopeptide (TPR) repeat protein